VSCASRKTSITKIESKTTADSLVDIKLDGTYVKENNTLSEEFNEEVEYKPIDTLKPMFIDGKQYKNTIIKLKKQKGIKLDKTKVTNKTSSVKKLNVKREEIKKVFVKEVNKKISYLTYLWFLIPIVTVSVLIKYWEKLNQLTSRLLAFIK
jgi:hypothetical protein